MKALKFWGSIRDKLSAAKRYPATVVVAPKGYGKFVLRRNLESIHKNARFYYLNLLSSDQLFTWESICKTVEEFSPAGAARLRNAVQDGHFHEKVAAKAILELFTDTEQDTYLVIDGFNILYLIFPLDVYSAFLQFQSENLRFLLFGRPFRLLGARRFDPYAINWIGAKDLMFYTDDIERYVQLQGLTLDQGECQQLFDVTGGWPAAIANYVRKRQSGDMPDILDITYETLNEVFYQQLSPSEQHFMMAVSRLDKVVKADIFALKPDDYDGGMRISDLLYSAPLVTNEYHQPILKLHPTFQKFLQNQLQNAPEEVRKIIIRKLAQRQVQLGNLAEAVGLYYEIMDCQGILSLDLKLLNFTVINGVRFEDIARDILKNCSDRTREANPLSLIRLAYLLFSSGDKAGYLEAMQQAARFINPQTQPQLHGEWIAMSMLKYFPDVSLMLKVLKQSKEFLREPNRAIAPEEPLFFGCPDLWYLLYNNLGEADLVAELLDEFMAELNANLNRNDTGAALLYRACLASMRCDYDLALSLADRAAQLGSGNGDAMVIYGLSMLRARIAIAQGREKDVVKALNVLDETENFSKSFLNSSYRKVMESTVRLMVLSMMREAGMISALTKGILDESYPDSILTRMTLHVRVLDQLSIGNVEQAVSMMKAELKRPDEETNTATKYTINIALSIFYNYMGSEQDALVTLKKALDIGMADNLVGMFVLHYKHLEALLAHESLAERYGEFITRIRGLHRFGTSKKVIQQSHGDVELASVLTDREKEVAYLAASGLRNAEIAERLFLTESTIKKHMRSVFDKLNIDRRYKLAEFIHRL